MAPSRARRSQARLHTTQHTVQCETRWHMNNLRLLVTAEGCGEADACHRCVLTHSWRPRSGCPKPARVSQGAQQSE